MSSGDAYVEADMETGIPVGGAAEQSKDDISTGVSHESSEMRKAYVDANFRSVTNTMLVDEKNVIKVRENPSLLCFDADEVSKKGENYKFQTGEEKYAIEELMHAPNYNDELKQVWGASEENANTEIVTDDCRPEIVEAIRSSTDTFEAGDNRDAGESERSDALVTTGFPKHLRNSLISYVRVNEGHDTALLIQGIQQSSALISTPLSSSLQTPSADTWLRHVGLSSSQKLMEGAAEESLHGGYRPGENFRRNPRAEDKQIDGIFPGGLAKESVLPSMGNSLKQPRQVQSSHFERLNSSTYKDRTELNDSTGVHAFAHLNSRVVGMEDSVHENKAVFSDYPLRRVLSDPLTGLFMDDAMVAQCGHSFGISSLHRVMEMNSCLTCGETIPPGSLIPNYALRAAVQAYKREEQLWPSSFKGSKRRRDHLEQPESSEGKKTNRVLAGSSENTITDGSRSKGVQFPFVVDDRVLIKGNKRTPERFVGREAIITTQCLNGWYLVRTLDNGESVRLQYRSLQKMGDKEVPAQSGDTACGAEGSRGHSSTSVPTSLSDDGKEDGSPSNLNDRMAASSSPPDISKDLRSDFLNRTNHGIQRETSMQAADLSGANLRCGGASSDASQELQTERNEEKVLEKFIPEGQDKSAHDTGTMNENAQRGLKIIHTVAGPRNSDDDVEGSSLETGCKVWHEEEECIMEGRALRQVTVVSVGAKPTDGGTFAPKKQVDDSVTMPKSGVIQAGSTRVTQTIQEFPESDLYKKVYVSGLRSHGVWDENTSISMKQSLSLDTNTGYHSMSPIKGCTQEPEENTSGVSARMQNVGDTCETVRDGMLNLESEIPWSCMRDVWKRCRSNWLQMLQDSKTAKDLGKRLQELRDALLLTKAGNMVDEEWNKHLSAALESEEIDGIAFLWGRIQEDVSKWMESKPKRNRKPLSLKSEIINLGDLQKLFPQLCVGGLSRAGISAATSVAAAEAFADGQQDTEALLAVPMRLIREHSKQDLLAVKEAIVREKRHITAKLMQLESSVIGNEDSKDEAVEVGLLIENPKQLPTSPAFLSVDAPFTTVFSNDLSILTSERCINYFDTSPIKDAGRLKGYPIQETDGEATDLSDSD